MLSSWYGGLWPGFLAALLSVVALDYYFILSLYALGFGPEEAPDMIAFVATALFISWLNGRGGGGNFGIVTSFRFQGRPVAQVFAGPMLWEHFGRLSLE